MIELRLFNPEGKYFIGDDLSIHQPTKHSYTWFSEDLSLYSFRVKSQ